MRVESEGVRVSLKQNLPTLRAYQGHRSVSMHAHVASQESHENCCVLHQNTCRTRTAASQEGMLKALVTAECNMCIQWLP